MRKLFGIVFVFMFFLSFPCLVLASEPVQNNSSYTTPSSPAASDGTSTETVKIHLQDANQANVSGAVITLSSSNNTTAKFPQNDQTTDANGDATFTVTSTTPGSTKITMFDSTNNTTFTDWFSITFYDATKGCVSIPSAPVLTSVVSNTNHKATLIWVNSPNPVTNYLVSFGEESQKYIYGDPNIGPQGTTTFTVGSLTGNKTYYFAVAANNNCGRSGFSNEVSVIVKPIPSSPTPKPTLVPTATITPSIPPVTTLVLYTPMPTETPKTAVMSSDTNVIRNWGIGIISTGVLLIAAAVIIQKVRDKNKIPILNESGMLNVMEEKMDHQLPQKFQDPIRDS